MECRGIDLEASPMVEEEEVDRTAMCQLETAESGRMVACELVAAEALADLARCRTVHGDAVTSGEFGRQPAAEADRPKVTQQFHEYASTAITSPEKIEKIVEKIPSQFCGTSCQSTSMGKSRPKLTEAEKEERKLRRVLANRESARQTIRRRKAMHLELTRKAADVLEENEKLKKEKEVAVNKYNSLKIGNEFLSTELAKLKKAEQGKMQEEPTTSSSQDPCRATTTNAPIFLHNQPSIVPCFWPSVLLSSESFPFQCASGMPCTHQGQENSPEINRQETPLFVVAVPWLLHFLTHGSTVNFRSGSNDTPENPHPSLLHEDNNHLSSSQNMNAEVSNSTRPTESLRPMRNDSSTPERIGCGLLHKSQEPILCPPKNPEDSFAATVARRRRKELMRLKSVHNHYDHLHYSAPG